MRIFKEEQGFRQWWLFLILGISTLIPIGIMISAYIKNKNTFSIQELFGIISLIVISIGIIFIFKLTTRIDENGIYYQFFPFHWSLKKINWISINKVYIRTYNPIRDYGGWGLKGGSHWSKSKGKAINVSGNIGIQLELKDGKKILIGTQKENEVKQVLETYKHKLNQLS
jgi:hypothetical protein